jgi:hypothetical protein
LVIIIFFVFIVVDKIISKSKSNYFHPEQFEKHTEAILPENTKTTNCDDKGYQEETFVEGPEELNCFESSHTNDCQNSSVLKYDTNLQY